MRTNNIRNMYRDGNFKSRYRMAGLKRNPMHYYMQQGGSKGLLGAADRTLGMTMQMQAQRAQTDWRAQQMQAQRERMQQVANQRRAEQQQAQIAGPRRDTGPRMFQGGGMYDDNTAAALGQGAGPQSTANIVYQESDPNLQAQRERQLQSTIQQQQQLGMQAQSEAEGLMREGEGAAEQAAFEKAGQVAGVQQMGKQGLQATASALQEMGVLGKSGSGLKAVGDAYKLQRAANLAQKAKLAGDTVKAAELTAKATDLAAKAGGTIGSSAATGATAALPGAGGAAVEAGKSALGAAAGKFLTSGAGLGLLSSGLGYGIQKLWGDDDPTKVNFAEGAGGVLSGAGSGAGIGSMILPGIGTALGGIIGGIAGGVGKFFGARKARRAKRKAEREYKRKVRKAVNKHNRQLMEDFGTNLAVQKAGALKQKTYSGYDLGQNVVAQMGGMRLGMPRYGAAV